MTVGLARGWHGSTAARLIALLLAAIALALAFKAYRVADKPGSGIELDNLLIAGDLLAGMRGSPPLEAHAHARMPGYPLLIAAVASLDGALAGGLGCREDRPALCAKSRFRTLYFLQYAVALSMLAAALLLAWHLSGSVVVAGIALALLYLGTRPGDLAGLVTWNIWHMALIHWGALMAVLAHLRTGPLYGLGAGAALGAAAALDPHAMVLAPVTAAVLIAVRWREARAWLTGLAVLAGGIAALGGIAWLAVRLGYNPDAAMRFLLFRTAERLDYNGLGLAPWLTAMVLPVPVIGDWLQAFVLPEGLTRRFAMYVKGSLAHQSLTETFPQAMAQAGSAAGGLSRIVTERVIEQPAAYLLALPPVLMRGLWGGASLVGLLGVFHVLVMRRYARAEGRGAALAVLWVPIAALLLVNTLATSNHYFLNPMLPFLYAYAIAYVSGGL